MSSAYPLKCTTKYNCENFNVKLRKFSWGNVTGPHFGYELQTRFLGEVFASYLANKLFQKCIGYENETSRTFGVEKNTFYYCNHYNAYFNVSITSRDTKSSRNLYVSSRLGECLDRELQRLVPIPAS